MASNKNNKKDKLLDFLNKKAFNPVLKASEKDYGSEDEKNKLKEVQKNTVNEKKRFERYESAEEIKQNYLKDLNSKTAKKVNKELSELDLPKLPELKDEFMDLCRKLDV